MATVLEQMRRQGVVETLQDSVVEVLEARFTTVPEDIAGRLDEIEDEERLHVLHREAATVETLEEFREKLDNP